MFSEASVSNSVVFSAGGSASRKVSASNGVCLQEWVGGTNTGVWLQEGDLPPGVEFVSRKVGGGGRVHPPGTDI